MKKISEKLPYLEFIESELAIPQLHDASPLVIDLFAGCGGLALGFEAAGFRTVGYEMLENACVTYRHNLHGECHQVTLRRNPDLVEGASVIIGGPPCQPFSGGGYQLGLMDSRDGFPIFLDAVKFYEPQLAMFENVRGMLFRNKAYFEEIVATLEKLGYIVDLAILNAAHYGVPQKRERLFCVAHKGGWRWPEKTYLHLPYTTGEALGELAFFIPPKAKFLTPSMDDYIRRYEAASKCIKPRDLHLDAPARTVTCRNLSAPTGDMLRILLPDGRRRRLTVREGALLQSFPNWFEFQGNEESQCNQIGNAVPPILAKALAISVKEYLTSLNPNFSKQSLADKTSKQLSLFPSIVDLKISMNKTSDAIEILKQVGMPKGQKNERSALTLLALLNLRNDSSWEFAEQKLLRIHDILLFLGNTYGKKYAENTRETIRRQTLHQFEQAGLVVKNPDDPKRPTTSPKTTYAVTDEALGLLRSYGTPAWETCLEEFVGDKEKLAEKYSKLKKARLVSTVIDGEQLTFSPGEHNELQIKTLEILRHNFFPKAKLIYIGDTANKMLFLDEEALKELELPITSHDKLPDIILYDRERSFLFIIEVVTSHGPVCHKRYVELENTFSECKLRKVYISAFPNSKEFKKRLEQIAWHTEVWIADTPDHMIHFNGPEFLYRH